MFGIAESAKLLMLPTAVFIVSIVAVIVVGPFTPSGGDDRSKPRAIRRRPRSGCADPEGFASGCSAVTGVEAMPQRRARFRVPRAAPLSARRSRSGVLSA